MRANILKLLLSVIIVVLICACHKESKNLPLLLKVDSIMQTNPDSAHYLLSCINATNLRDEETRALYALLQTQANDKKSLPNTNDSLILIAVNYYEHTTNHNLQSRAYFYLGRVLQKNNKITEAINAYLKALNSQPNNYITQVQAYDNLAECYENQNFMNKALEMYKKSHAINIENKDSSRIIFPLRGIANIYLIKGEITKAIGYYNQALHILKDRNDSIWESTINCDLARLFHSRENYMMAYKYINRAFNESNPSNDISAILYWKGTILSGLGRNDSAYYYLKKASLSDDIYTQAASFQSLYELRKQQGFYIEATSYNDKALVLYDSIQNSQYQEEINDILKEHALTITRQEQSQMHIKQMAVLYICSSTGIALLIIVFMHISSRKKKELIKLQKELINIISDKNELKEELRMLSLANEDTKKRDEELQVNLLELWQQSMQICQRLFKTTDSFKKITSIEKKRYLPDRATKQEDVKSIRIEIKSTFAEARQNLQELYPTLTQDDILYCILSYLKLSDATIKICMEVASSPALAQRKYRIKKQLTKQVFDYIF